MPRLNTPSILKGIRSSADHGKPLLLWDDTLKGFGVRITPQGMASYLVKRRLGEGGRKAKAVWHVFGRYPEVSPGDAREVATGLLLAIGRGEHLNRDRRSSRLLRASSEAHTLSACISEYVAKRSNGHAVAYWASVDRILCEAASLIGPNLPIAEVCKQKLLELIDTKAERYPEAARKMQVILHAFLQWVKSRDLIATNPLEGISSPSPVQSRDRVLSDDELATLWRAFSSLGYPFGPFYKLLLLTGQRRDEVAGMKWEEVNLVSKEWTIPKERTKNNRSHTVHLSPQVIDILTSIPKINSRYVLTTTGDTPISGYSRAKQQVDALTPSIIVPWRVHDLRRTAASGLAASGVQPFIIERILNHISGVNGGLVGVYQRHEYVSERREALALWGKYVQEVSCRRALVACAIRRR